MQESEFTGSANKVQGKAGGIGNFAVIFKIERNEFASFHPSRYVDAFYSFLYDEFVGRLAQRLERSVYTRKVVRSNRTVPTIVTQHPSAGT
jgi:hypothetical protein